MTSRITELESKLAEARHNYYNYEPTVDDATYDAWRDELEELQADNLMVTAIGAEPSSAWPRVKHEVPMGSLDKVNSLDAMTTWIRKFRRNQSEELLLSDKLDGLSVSVIYEGGRLIRGVTRGGDAQVGEDITPNVVRMIGVPKSIEEQSKITFRGEIVLHTDTLAKFFPEYSNTRNGAAGISRRLDGKGCDRLYVYFYRVAQSDKEFEKVSDQFEFLTSSGFLVPRWYVTAMIPGVKTPHDLWVEYQQTIRDSLPYAIDGLVMELNDLEYQESLGMNHLRPVGAVACKFAPITRETVIRSRVDQVGGTGKITPVFGFDPVRVLGAEIQRASLYNQGFVEELKLDIGAKVLVTRANDVIPKVVSVVQGTGTVSQAPSVCPECGTPVVRDGKFIL